MALVVGVNSYVTVAEADAYFADRYGYDLWPPLDNTAKEQALVSAAGQLDLMCAWYGQPKVADQDLAFPRNYQDEVPQEIKDAQCEIAYSIVSSGGTATAVTAEAPLKKMKADVVEFEWETTSAKTGGLANDTTKALLAPWGECHYLTAGARIVDVSRAN